MSILKIKYFVILSILLFLASLTQSIDDIKGWQLLFFGILGITKGKAICLLWLANPALAFSWMTTKIRDVSLRLSILAAILALSFYILMQFSNTDKIRFDGLGYSLWTLSCITMVLGNLIAMKNKASDKICNSKNKAL